MLALSVFAKLQIHTVPTFDHNFDTKTIWFSRHEYGLKNLKLIGVTRFCQLKLSNSKQSVAWQPSHLAVTPPPTPPPLNEKTQLIYMYHVLHHYDIYL